MQIPKDYCKSVGQSPVLQTTLMRETLFYVTVSEFLCFGLSLAEFRISPLTVRDCSNGEGRSNDGTLQLWAYTVAHVVAYFCQCRWESPTGRPRARRLPEA